MISEGLVKDIPPQRLKENVLVVSDVEDFRLKRSDFEHPGIVSQLEGCWGIAA